MRQRLLIIGTSHVGSLRKAAKYQEGWTGEIDFVAFGVPVWRLMLNQSELVIRSNALNLVPRDSQALVDTLATVGPGFERVVERVRGLLGRPEIVTNLDAIGAVVFVDCLFRYPAFLEGDLRGNPASLIRYRDQPVTLDLLIELPNVAGAVTSFAAPFSGLALPFQRTRRTSFVDLFCVLRDVLGGEVPFFLWTFPGFREQFPVGPGTDADLRLMERVHRYALQRDRLDIHYLRPPDGCLDLAAGRVSSQFLGDGFHATDAFGQLAWPELLSAVRARN